MRLGQLTPAGLVVDGTGTPPGARRSVCLCGSRKRVPDDIDGEDRGILGALKPRAGSTIRIAQ